MNAEADLRVARELARAGVPLFLAHPDPAERSGYRLPARWDAVEADPGVADAWRPGMALCAVMGRGLDLVDLDPRNFDGATLGEYPDLPDAVATADTPSGGRHVFVLSLGLPSLDGVRPGLDYKGGDPLGNGRGFAFIPPTVRTSKVDGQARPYTWDARPDLTMLANPDLTFTGAVHLRSAIAERRAARAEGRPRTVPASVAAREWDAAVRRLEADVRRWAATGWGGEAHAGLLAHTTHLARLWPEGAEDGYVGAFRVAGVEPDEHDLAKLESALRHSVPDVVVPDAQMSREALFWAGAEVPADRPRPGPPSVGQVDPAAEGGPFDFCDPAELDAPREPPAARYGAFGGQHALFYAEGVHWLQGESESGKTWVGLAVLLDVLRDGRAALMVDYEDSRAEVIGRLRCLGAAREDVGRLVYLDGHDVAYPDLVTHLARTDRDYGLLLVDGVTSALTAAGCSGRDEQELTAWADAVPRRARMAVCVDHVVKSPDERNGMAIGTQAKKSVVTGTSFEVRCRDKFGIGRTGAVELRLQKDKRGGVRALGREVFRLRFTSDPATGAVSLTAFGVAGVLAATAEAFLGASLPAEDEAKVAALVRVLQEDPRSNPTQSMRVLLGRIRDLGHRGDDRKVLRPACRRFMAGAGVPVAPEGASDDDD